MAQMDDSIGEILKHLEDIGEAENTIVIFTTDNGAEVFTWPDGGMTPFKASKGTSYEGGFRVPAIIRWPGHVKPGSVENGIFSGLDWFPTLLAAAGNPDITNQLLKGVKLGDRTYKNHLDGYDQIGLAVRRRGHPLGMSSSTLAALNWAPFALTISSSSSSSSRGAGQGKRSPPTCQRLRTLRGIPSSACLHSVVRALTTAPLVI